VNRMLTLLTPHRDRTAGTGGRSSSVSDQIARAQYGVASVTQRARNLARSMSAGTYARDDSAGEWELNRGSKPGGVT
jgi:hypothetical protein